MSDFDNLLIFFQNGEIFCNWVYVAVRNLRLNELSNDILAIYI